MEEQRCSSCGNTYESTFVVEMEGRRHRFDSFECAIHALAPVCGACGVRVIGHGVKANDRVFCSAHCARHETSKGEQLETNV